MDSAETSAASDSIGALDVATDTTLVCLTRMALSLTAYYVLTEMA
jgi:hypothetical protein